MGKWVHISLEENINAWHNVVYLLEIKNWGTLIQFDVKVLDLWTFVLGKVIFKCLHNNINNFQPTLLISDFE